jgi:hypothetical protein
MRANPLGRALVGAALLALVVAAPAAGAGASVDRIEHVETVLVVAFPDDWPIASISRAECAFVQRVEFPDGSSTETMQCQLTDKPVEVPEFQGSAPKTAFHNSGGPCAWFSDYWAARDGTLVIAESFHYVVTPSGRVSAHSSYPAEPVVCE